MALQQIKERSLYLQLIVVISVGQSAGYASNIELYMGAGYGQFEHKG